MDLHDIPSASVVHFDREIVGGGMWSVVRDRLTEASVIDAAERAFGGIDILVNNAGGSTNMAHASWFDAPLAEWLDEYKSNTLPAVRLVQAFVPGMRERRWGRVIQVSSRNAISPHAQFGPYGASKAALNNFTLSLSKALAGTGVTSNGIMPGLIDTPALDGWFREVAARQGGTDPAEGRAWVLKNAVHQTVARLGTPADIAAPVCFLASPLADFMTGTTVRIDGGATPTL